MEINDLAKKALDTYSAYIGGVKTNITTWERLDELHADWAEAHEKLIVAVERKQQGDED